MLEKKLGTVEETMLDITLSQGRNLAPVSTHGLEGTQ